MDDLISRAQIRASIRVLKRCARSVSALRNLALPAAATLGIALAGAANAQVLRDAVGGPAPAMQPSAAAQISALQQIKSAKTPVQDKIGSRLFLAMLHQRRDARLASLTEFQFLGTEKDGRTPVDITLVSSDGATPLLQKLHDIGADLVSPKQTAYNDRTVRARVRLEDLETLAGMKQVSKVREAAGAITHVVNVSQGDKTHGADIARGTYGATGAGVKVCALSDGASNLAASQASGDLPAVDVLPGQVGSGDEGTAMLEIVHDLAPAATLGFATAFTSEASFAQNIRDLGNPAIGACNIIVDDVIYFDESPFQDGPVAQAVNAVTAAGVLYFSSAGNENSKSAGNSGTWEGDFLASTLPNPTPLAGIGPLHNFGDGGQSIRITSSGGPTILGWAESYDLAGGIASTDYDLYVLNSRLTSVIEASMDRQNGAGGDDIPFEGVNSGAAGQRLVVNRFAAGTTSSAPLFNLIVFRGSIDSSLATTGASRGHSSAATAFSVAATPAAASFDGITPDGPFPNLFTGVNASESFSSDGPRRIILNPNGSEVTPGNRTVTGGVVRQKPELTAADGVATAAPGFNPFYGTSAAAPHAAAIAALLKSALPSLTQVQVRNFLTSTAIDIETPGVDNTTGAGIVMPTPALAAAGATPQPFLSAGAPVFTEVFGDGDAFIEPNETWSIRVPLSNVGAAKAGSINATLSSSSSNITITTAASGYKVIPPGASRNNQTAFVFEVGSGFSCGGTISFSLGVAFNGTSSPQTFPFGTGTGGVGATRSFSYAGEPVAIPDAGAAVNASVTVSGVKGNIGDVNLSIDGASCNADIGSTTVGLDHTFVGDLVISLVSPKGLVVPLISRAGAGGNNFCQTLLDDESTGPSIQTVVSTDNPFTGSFKPASPLSAFDGRAAKGKWQLRAQDFAGVDVGSIRAFTLSVAPVICDAPQPAKPTPRQ